MSMSSLARGIAPNSVQTLDLSMPDTVRKFLLRVLNLPCIRAVQITITHIHITLIIRALIYYASNNEDNVPSAANLIKSIYELRGRPDYSNFVWTLKEIYEQLAARPKLYGNIMEYVIRIPTRHFIAQENELEREALLASAQNLKARISCKVCYQSVMQIILFPCSHLSTCMACTSRLTTCPICRAVIRATVRVYY